MNNPTLLFIIFIGAIAVSFLIYIALRAYKYKKLTKNEAEGIQKANTNVDNKDKVDVGAQRH